jgi:hypothetical protein
VYSTIVFYVDLLIGNAFPVVKKKRKIMTAKGIGSQE